LAAGADESTAALLTQGLAGSSVIGLAATNVASVVPQDAVVVVVSEQNDQIQQALGAAWRYVPQTVRAGTGDAVRCARFALEDFAGDVLIAYGDTPLLRPSSLKALLNRHRLKGAQFSLLTAKLRQAGHYDLIKRDIDGELRGIGGQKEGNPSGIGGQKEGNGSETGSHSEIPEPDGQTSAPYEVNVGAYVVDSALLIPGLDIMAERGEHRLTELAGRLIAQGVKTATYTVLDPDEVQGINSPAELRQAADIVIKRLFSPVHAIESGEISFGTGGWRAKIGEGFTLHNVRRLCQVLANQVIRDGQETQGVVIGGDRRFLSKESAEAAAEVFAGNNIPVTLLPDDVPTPLVTFACPHLSTAYGLVFTASHNPPQWNGLKVFRSDGSLPLQDQTDAWEREANAIGQGDVVSLDLDLAKRAGMVTLADLTNAYIDAIERIVDVSALRDKGLRVLVDPMYGTSKLTLGTVLSDGRCRVEFIHDRHNPLFGGRSPAPDEDALSSLIAMVKAGPYDLGMATDGDADRIAIVDEQGRYVTTNDLLLLIYYYLHQVRGQRGAVVRNLATTQLLDRLAASYGECCYEVPVGFKHVTQAMLEHDALLGGESSGGLTIRGHILGKDGIFACALIVEMLARTGRRLSELLEDIYRRIGRMYAGEASVAATPDMRLAIPRRLEAEGIVQLAARPVIRTDTFDGYKFYLPDDEWALLRFSGTEPVLRLFAEAATPQRLRAIIDGLTSFATGGPAPT
jgi:phosphomannomutase/CTP:molybdopterin cytidylyltransferase MocA